MSGSGTRAARQRDRMFRSGTARTAWPDRQDERISADIVWTVRHNASLLAFGLAVHLRR